MLDTGEVNRTTQLHPHTSLSVYDARLVRDGWRLVGSRRKGKAAHRRGLRRLLWLVAGFIGADNDKHIKVFEKRATHGWILRKNAIATSNPPAGKGCYYEEHELVNTASGAVLPYPGWEWAEVDADRLVWAEGGKLFAGKLSAEGLAHVKELHDFNGYRFTPIAAPY